MKKILLLFCASALIITLCKSCSYDEYASIWMVHNHTEQELIFRYPNLDGTSYTEQSLPSSGTIRLWAIAQEDPLPFLEYFNRVVNKYGDNAYWQILHGDGTTVLRTWTYSNIGQEDQRFFDRMYWHSNGDYGGDRKTGINAWTFYILPEDIE
jgi:hypothetical protein